MLTFPRKFRFPARRADRRVRTSLKCNELNSWKLAMPHRNERMCVCASSGSEWSNPITNDFIRLLLFLLNCDYIVRSALTQAEHERCDCSWECLSSPENAESGNGVCAVCARQKKGYPNPKLGFCIFILLFWLRFLPRQWRAECAMTMAPGRQRSRWRKCFAFGNTTRNKINNKVRFVNSLMIVFCFSSTVSHLRGGGQMPSSTV